MHQLFNISNLSNFFSAAVLNENAFPSNVRGLRKFEQNFLWQKHKKVKNGVDSTFIHVLGARFVNLIPLDVQFRNWKEWVQKVKETFSVMRFGAMCAHSYHSDLDEKCTNILFSCYLTFLGNDKNLQNSEKFFCCETGRNE